MKLGRFWTVKKSEIKENEKRDTSLSDEIFAAIKGEDSNRINCITLKYKESITNMYIPDGVSATLNTFRKDSKITLDCGAEAILSRPISVIIVAPNSIDTTNIIAGIENILNPVKLNIEDLKFYSFDEAYANWLKQDKQ